MKLGRSWVLTPLAVVALAAGSYAAYRWLTPPSLPGGLLYGSGHIEGTEVTVASQVSARVVESTMVEGANVRAGDVLVRLDAADLRSQLERAQSELAAAQLQRETLVRQLATARHHLANAQADDRRYAALLRDGTIPAQRREQAANALAEADARVATLTTGIEQTEQHIESQRKSVELAESQVDKAVVVAPIDGTLLVKSIEVGELAAPGRSIATIVDLSKVELKVYVPESDVGKLSLGNDARMRTDAFPDRYFDARVARIDSQAQFTPRDIHMPDERVRLVFGVTLRVDNPSGRLKPGMPADAWVRWDTAASFPAKLIVPQ